ncbi:unnamed protein product [Phaedon cochleariae]|uniref:C2H2-type domain-containing protein n=1 Tax=Phaedon cochleariae TaxID=80249 RepID=A0A9P0GNL2_PHACE|nr:unnamed protein product [Phaedon cochleariae]
MVKCPTCGKTFSCKKHLHKHLLVHSDDFKHKCCTCGKGFKAAYNMRVHMRSHEAVKPFQCSICLKTFTTKHLVESTSIEYPCEICHRVFDSLDFLNIHRSCITPRFNCRHCPYALPCECPQVDKTCFYCGDFVSIEDILGHLCFHGVLKQKTAVKLYFCPVCRKPFSNGTNMQEHLKMVRVIILCQMCLDFVHEDHTCDDQFWRCAFCKKPMRKRISKKMVDHICFHEYTEKDLEILEKSELSECDKCGLMLHKKKMANHLKTHLFVKCNICGEVKTKSTLRTHLRQVHQRVECEFCDQCFDSKLKYRNHCGAEHSTRICDICGTTLTTSQGLWRHKQRVHGNRDFKCSDCELSFATRCYLKRHMLVHGNEYKHKCPECGKGVKNKFNLRVHMRSHDKVKPLDESTSLEYPCEICHRLFDSLDFLNIHRSCITPRFNCLHCPYALPCECPQGEKTCFYCEDFVPIEDIVSHLCFHGVLKQKAAVKLYFCPVCLKRFSNGTNMQEHLKMVRVFIFCQVCLDFVHEDHTCEDQFWKCAYCRKGIRNKGKRKIVDHICFHEKNEKDFEILKKSELSECNKCGLLLHKLKMANHLETHLVMECKICKKLMTKLTIRTHLEKVHHQVGCEFCDQCFDSKEKYRKHCSTKHSRTNCDICGTMFATIRSLERHKLLAHHNGDFKCSDCEHSFVKPSFLKRHMLVHGNKHRCPECGKGVKNKYSLKVHMSLVESTSLEYPCEICHRLFDSLDFLNIHRSCVTPRFNCIKCPYADISSLCKCPQVDKTCFYCGDFVPFEDIVSHLCFHGVLKQQAAVKLYFCTVCLKPFSNVTNMQEHLKMVRVFIFCQVCLDFVREDHTCEDQFWKCVYCKKPIRNKRFKKIVDHICFHENNEKDFEILKKSELSECDKCGLVLHKKKMANHLETHIFVECKICGEFRTKSTLRAHLEKVHHQIECEFCDQCFDSKVKYRKHCSVEHSDRVCDICGIMLATSSGLRKHKQRSHGNRNFNCNDCEMSFPTPSYLKRHMLVHSNEFKHKCPECGKGVKNKCNLKVHMRSHDKVKPFECLICNKTFTTKQWRDNHLKTHKAE